QTLAMRAWRYTDETDAPGPHGERLAAAQPGPQEIGGEEKADEELQQVAHAAGGGIAAAAREEEHPGGEESDREEEKRFVDHACQAPRESRRRSAHRRFFSAGGVDGGTRLWRFSGGSAWYSAQASRSCSRFSGGAFAMRL